MTLEKEMLEQLRLLLLQHKEPLLTWNLFSTPLCIFILGIWWKLMLDRKEKRDIERGKLVEENLELKEKAVDAWREGFAKNLCAVKNSVDDWRNKHEKALEEIADKVESVNSKLYGLVTKADCEDDHSKAEEVLSDHGEKIVEHGEKIAKLETTVEIVKNRFKWEILP